MNNSSPFTDSHHRVQRKKEEPEQPLINEDKSQQQYVELEGPTSTVAMISMLAGSSVFFSSGDSVPMKVVGTCAVLYGFAKLVTM
jgi:hypothetical protein